MKWWRSLRFRLLATTTPVLLLGIFLSVMFIFRNFEATLTRQFDVRLTVYLDQVAAVVGGDQIAKNLQQQLGSRNFSYPYSGLYWQAQNEDGQILRSRSLWDEKIELPVDTVGYSEIHTHEVPGPNRQNLRVLERRVISPNNTHWSIAVGADRAGLDAELHEFYDTLVRFGLALFALAVLIALIQIFVMQRPVLSLGRAIKKLQSGARSSLMGNFPSELDLLIGNLNSLSQHNKDIENNARMQATNLAHTIKTPLAILKNEIDDLRKHNIDADWSVFEDNLLRIDKLSQFYLARASVTQPRDGTKMLVHVRPVAFGIVQALRRLYEHEDIEIKYQCSETAVFRGDAVDLEELLGNLLDNAVKWANRLVTLKCESDETGLHLSVKDDGPGIPENHRVEILEPGKRLDNSVPGTGFGLAIAAELVKSYKGTMSLSEATLQSDNITGTCPGLHVGVFFPR